MGRQKVARMMVASVLPFPIFFFSRPCFSFPVNPFLDYLTDALDAANRSGKRAQFIAPPHSFKSRLPVHNVISKGGSQTTRGYAAGVPGANAGDRREKVRGSGPRSAQTVHHVPYTSRMRRVARLVRCYSAGLARCG